MELQEVFELYKNGDIAKGSMVKLHDFDKPQKIHAIANVDEESMVFSFTIFNNDDSFQSVDIEEFVSKPFVLSNKKEGLKDDNVQFARAADRTAELPIQVEIKERSRNPFPLKEKENFVTIQPKVLDYLSKRINNKREKCPIVDECVGMLNLFQENGNKDNIADVIIKLSEKLNELI